MNESYAEKLASGLQFTFVDLIKDTVIWLLIGFIISAALVVVIPPEFLAKWGNGPYAYLMMAIIGVPMYICATASTPIAASLLFSGVSPGAVLVFLLVGPATNAATLAMVKSEMGHKVLGIYLGAIVIVGFLFAGLTDFLIKKHTITSIVLAHHHTSNSSLEISSVL